MTELFKFLSQLVTNYGVTFAVLFLLIIIILFGLYFIIKTFPDVIRKYIEGKLIESNEVHRKGNLKRKNISPKILNLLSNLVVDTKSDRALLFEFSNGTSNLAGLPFLFLNATTESLSIGTSSIAQIYQRINISLFAKFISELEDNGYFYVEDIEEIKDTYPMIYAYMKPNDAKSMLFYSIYGVDVTLGFIVITTVGDKTFERKDVLPWVAESAQMISSLLNFEELEDTIK